MRTDTLRLTTLPPIVLALAAQGVAVLIVGAAAWVGAQGIAMVLPLNASVVLTGIVAAVLGARWGLPRWWIPLQSLFVPALYWGLQLDIPSWIYLAAFVATLLVLNNSVGDRVPLYLSSTRVWKTVAGLLPPRDGVQFVDLGSGLGGGLRWLASRFPTARFVGVESSPLPWLISRWRLRGFDNAQTEFRGLWDYPLGESDVVYVFLSPAPMARLWEKARREMRPGTLLISNSFAVPGVEPDERIPLNDRRRSELYVWRM